MPALPGGNPLSTELQHKLLQPLPPGDEIHRLAAGKARKISNACAQSLMHAARIGKRIIGDHMV